MTGNEEHKGYEIVNDGTYGMCFIRSIGKGALPKCLRGVYTKKPLAKASIDAYLNQKAKEPSKRVLGSLDEQEKPSS